jgi:hypothetical protein
VIRLPFWFKVVAVATVLTGVAAAIIVPAVIFGANGQYFIFIDLIRLAEFLLKLRIDVHL